MKMNTISLLRLVVCALAILSFEASAATTSTYSMKITATMPKTSAGGLVTGTQPSNTKFSPCNNTAIGDAVTITLAYNAGSTAADLRDVYLFFYNPSAAGYNSDPRVFVVSKTNLTSGGPALDPRADIQDVSAGTDAYLSAAQNLGGAKTETLFGDYILLDGAADGTWQIVGIIADSTKIDFDDPSTWEAWDVATLILGKPWTGSPYTLCK